MMLDMTSAPTTSACSTAPVATIDHPTLSAYVNPEHAAPRSKPQAFSAPIFACTMHAVLGNIVSGVVVPTTMNPMSFGREPASAIAACAAGTAMSDVADAGIDDVPLADAGALKDPLVGRVDHLLEIGVRQHARRHVRAESRDLHPPQRVHHKRSFPGAISPKYS